MTQALGKRGNEFKSGCDRSLYFSRGWARGWGGGFGRRGTETERKAGRPAPGMRAAIGYWGLGKIGVRMMGPLEIAVMEILWAGGESSVHDVVARLPRALAYTTVMTTLDRLYKKGLLDRRKEERAFLYAPRLSRAEWERKRAGDFLAAFLRGPKPAG